MQTLGNQVVDAFYVVDDHGDKITDSDTIAEIERAIVFALSVGLMTTEDPKVVTKSGYEKELARLQTELVLMQEWIEHEGLRLVVIFEGRDTAGKGGTIKRIMERLNARYARVVALGTPTERERTQWYFQRYIPHLPAAGEIVLFDRSWYNRAGVEHVMGFCTEEEYADFLRTCPMLERALVRSGIILMKYWLSLSDEEQERRFTDRIENPGKRWKLSPMDLQARAHWVDYAEAKDEMFAFTDIKEAPWYVVDADNKRTARLNLISHLLEQFRTGKCRTRRSSCRPDRSARTNARRSTVRPGCRSATSWRSHAVDACSSADEAYVLLRQVRSNGSRHASGAIELVDRVRAPRPRRVRTHRRRVLEQRLRRFPQALDALRAREERVVAEHRVVDQAFVRLEQIGCAPGLVQRELQALLVEPHARTGTLAVERQRQPRRVGEVEREVVGTVRADARVRREHALRRLAERDRDDARAFRHALAGTQVERHAGPTPVVDLAAQRDERLGLGVRTARRARRGSRRTGRAPPVTARSGSAIGTPCSSLHRSTAARARSAAPSP